ncbi:ornithine aminomutase subunit alpha [Clostridium sp. CM028]|uniref:ornithine aminomutase subunit alpha n=1 Tax=Clostridium TaxID=1485 RepID=UPI0013EED6DD|nr:MULTISPECIES: ornithine aminomutase subunit alpha [Clostridium]MBU3090486.1 ornithine aminomutase subunit alpha [Clostridium sp. CF011]MBW9145883.1 ornithine aminomutase subunit alpha [Clostridium sp. CM027]MBW9149572.1 ornithine aminomutase subunit alpha [Clostridium sp. CM028]MBZ9608799.1 ornithine aminomutase subunit alpha [Clostridium estertheticum]UVE40863.1 ornithine aminomutase subunit alpha [Clostridium sp. CM027]
MKREDDFEKRREHLKGLTNDQLYERFWSLTNQVVKPMVDLAYTHTSPAIERSVVLRMGFSSMQAQPIISYAAKWNLIGKGIGNVILTYAKLKNMDYLKAGAELSKGIGWDIVSEKMKGSEN